MSGSSSTTLSQPDAIQSSAASSKTFSIPVIVPRSAGAPDLPATYGVLVSANQNMTVRPSKSTPSVAAAARSFRSATSCSPRSATSKISASSWISWYSASTVSGVVRGVPPLTLLPLSQSVGERYELMPVSPSRSRATTPPSVL
jgi:hypothetical protein